MPRKRKKGEQEIRILPDGRIVLVAPDEAMLNLAQTIASDWPDENETIKRKTDDREQDTSDKIRGAQDGPAGPAAK